MLKKNEIRSKKLMNGWMSTANPVVTRELLSRFMKDYIDRYSEKNQSDLKKYLQDGVGSYMNQIELFQIYSYLGLMKPEDDIYEGYYKKMSENFDTDCNILDVACGYVPAFGMIVAEKQLKLSGRGTITVCDPALISETCKDKNMKLVKDPFDSNYDISKYDLITGIMPCSTTRDIIKAACENNKDFYIGLCGCPPEEYTYDDGENYLTKNLNYARDMCYIYGRELCETELDPNYVVRMPVVYSKKK